MMFSSQFETYCSKLEKLYSVMQRLRPSSTADDYDLFASFFTPDCIVYLKSMNMHRMPGISRHEAIEDMKEVISKMHIEKRNVLHRSMAGDGKTILCETKQRVNVMGEVIEEFYETEVVTFDEDGLIKVFKLYNCWSPVVRIVQDKTGHGPYAEGERRERFEAYVKQAAITKVQKRKAREDAESAQPASIDLEKAGCCA